MGGVKIFSNRLDLESPLLFETLLLKEELLMILTPIPHVAIVLAIKYAKKYGKLELPNKAMFRGNPTNNVFELTNPLINKAVLWGGKFNNLETIADNKKQNNIAIIINPVPYERITMLSCVIYFWVDKNIDSGRAILIINFDMLPEKLALNIFIFSKMKPITIIVIIISTLRIETKKTESMV